jgi:hypothetical protein
MFSKRIEIFKKASNSLKISLKCHAFFKKPDILKKEPHGNCRIARMASPPRKVGELSHNSESLFVSLMLGYFCHAFLVLRITSVLKKQAKFPSFRKKNTWEAVVITIEIGSILRMNKNDKYAILIKKKLSVYVFKKLIIAQKIIAVGGAFLKTSVISK